MVFDPHLAGLIFDGLEVVAVDANVQDRVFFTALDCLLDCLKFLPAYRDKLFRVIFKPLLFQEIFSTFMENRSVDKNRNPIPAT